MSDARAIEAVTATLVRLVDDAVKEVGGARAIAQPPHEVQTNGDPLQVNLFLYQTDVDGALRNEDAPDRLPGETGDPPLPLVLHYLLTPYVRDGKDIDAHRLLGLAVRALQEQALLSRTQLADAAPFSDVAQQLERIRITWQPLGEKDIYSLWSAFQTPYRLSTAFEVRAVLIDSRRPPRTPVPVLKRGRQDEGPVARGDLESPFPELTAAVPAGNQPAARLGEQVVLRGANLAAQTVEVRLSHPLVPDPVTIAVPAADAGADQVQFSLGDHPAGLWSVSLALGTVVTGDQVSTVTNEIPLAIAPKITNVPMDVGRDAAGAATIKLTCAPAPLPGQPMLLLLGGRAVPPDPPPVPPSPPQPPDHPQFTVTKAEVGKHLVRLRIGGVDSLLIDRSGQRPRFDDTQTVTVT
ncbi:MAG: DUF4255 domain-containing protein [Pseudonocardiaceae bacterium]